MESVDEVDCVAGSGIQLIGGKLGGYRILPHVGSDSAPTVVVRFLGNDCNAISWELALPLPIIQGVQSSPFDGRVVLLGWRSLISSPALVHFLFRTRGRDLLPRGLSS